MQILNLGILAHVDAGKTTLTERLLHTAGAISVLGSVDAGTTQTDSMALERQRGITIRAAVVGCTIGELSLNLIDTPGHPDFIAEVERSLRVLDGAVLVVSAVEGVQAQTVVLMRALRRLRVPTLIFVNKVDRAGADPYRVLSEIRQRLTPDVIALGRVEDAGRSSASYRPWSQDDPAFLDELLEVLVEHDDNLLTYAVSNDPPGPWMRSLFRRLAAQTAAAEVHPVLFGSAATGAGIDALVDGLTHLLPAADRDPTGAPSGRVFKVDRGPRGVKVAYVRMFSGSVHVRDRIDLGAERTPTVSAVRVLANGAVMESEQLGAGQIGTLYGLRDVRVGDDFGEPPRQSVTVFAPPTMESVVVPRDPAQRAALHVALAQLAEQDPLINVRQDDERHELLISLYGEVQKEVIQHALEVDFGVEVEFHDTSVICTERISGTGSALLELGEPANPYVRTIGLELAPAPVGSGVDLQIAVEVEAIPLYVYKSVDAFRDSMVDYLSAALRQGLSGWPVEDCAVTLTRSGYNSPSTTAADFRQLTPLVLRAALERAGTVVCEPIQHFRVDAPAETVSAVFGLLTRHRGRPQGPVVDGAWFWVEGDIPAAEVQAVQRQLHRATHGAGVLEVSFDRYEPAPAGHTLVRSADGQPGQNPIGRPA